jgi:Flp pilus assembly protein TadD
MKTSDYLAAAKHFHEVVRLEPNNVEAWHNLGYAYEKQDMTGTAKRFYTKALGLDPHYQEAYINLGVIAELEGNFEEARQNYLEATKAKGNSAYAHFCLAMLYERLDLFDEAIAAYQETLACNPTYLKALFNMASTALLVPAPAWYPRLHKEDTHGRACESGRAAGAERGSGGLPGALPAS